MAFVRLRRRRAMTARRRTSRRRAPSHKENARPSRGRSGRGRSRCRARLQRRWTRPVSGQRPATAAAAAKIGFGVQVWAAAAASEKRGCCPNQAAACSFGTATAVSGRRGCCRLTIRLVAKPACCQVYCPAWLTAKPNICSWLVVKPASRSG